MGSYRIRSLSSSTALESLASFWEASARGVPFRGPTWLQAWWRHYGCGDDRELFAFVIEDDTGPQALVPWYVERSSLGGDVVRPLGSGAVCSDYLTIPCAPGIESVVAEAFAEHLCGTARDAWDRIDFDAAVVGDPFLTALFEQLAARGAQVERRTGVNCWRLALPPAWDDYLALLSKSHRKQLRRLSERTLDTSRAVWHTTRVPAEFDRDWTIFLDLHQRRRYMLGEPGCFADPTFAAFHEDVARQFLLQGRLRLHRLELDGKPIAAEYHLAGDGIVYAYQSGLDPDALTEEPGRLAGIAVIREAIADGMTHYDLLRGDESYKAHWRAEPTPTERASIAGPRISSRLRFALLRRARRIHHSLGKRTKA